MFMERELCGASRVYAYGVVRRDVQCVSPIRPQDHRERLSQWSARALEPQRQFIELELQDASAAQSDGWKRTQVPCVCAGSNRECHRR